LAFIFIWRATIIMEGIVDYIGVLDFEATCGIKKRYTTEIIEFPVVFVNTRTLKIDFEFHTYVRPTVRPMLTNFCTNLTGIRQNQVNKAPPIHRVLRQFEKFVREQNLVHFKDTKKKDGARTYVLASDGGDLESFLHRECIRKRYPIPAWSLSYLDVRELFAEHFQMKKQGIVAMLDKFEMGFEGREHAGIDDARNIARILVELAKDGAPLSPNKEA